MTTEQKRLVVYILKITSCGKVLETNKTVKHYGPYESVEEAAGAAGRLVAMNLKHNEGTVSATLIESLKPLRLGKAKPTP